MKQLGAQLKDTIIKASIQVLMDGQAYLYAQFFRLQAEMLGKEISDEEFMKWQDEWKEQSAELIQRALILEGADDDGS
jgi:hypothetical protein